jgi:hypothetical protein
MIANGREIRRRRLSFLLNLAVALILAALVFQAVYQSLYIARRFVSDGRQPHFIESVRVERALAVARGESVFGNKRDYPYWAIGYGPMIYYPVGFFLRLAGQPESLRDQARQAVLAGRGLALLGGFAILAGLVFLGFHFRLRGVWLALPVLFFFCARPVYEMIYVFRGDMPMAACALWAWIVALRGRGKTSVLVSATLMVLAFSFKPPALGSAFFLGTWLLLGGHFKRAFLYGGAYWLLLGGLKLFGSLATDDAGGEVFQTSHVATMLDKIHLEAAWVFLFDLARKPVALLPFAGGLLAPLILFCRDEENASKSPPPVAALFAFWGSFVASEVMVVRLGSGFYYYIEPYVWGVLLLSLLARHIATILQSSLCYRRFALRRLRSCCYFFGLIVAVSLLLFAQHTRRLWSERSELGRLETWAELHPELPPLLGAVRGEILLDQGDLYWHTQAKPTLLSPQGWSASVAMGRRSPEPVLEKLRRGDYELIVLRYDASRQGIAYQGVETFPPVVNREIVAHYSLEAYINPYYIYRPRTASEP